MRYALTEDAVRLPSYNVTITISDPDAPATKAEFLLERFARETLLRMELLGMLVQEFERGGENGNGNGNNGNDNGRGGKPAENRGQG